MTTKKRSKLRVYIYRAFILSLVSLTIYGAYEGYTYMQPTSTTVPTAQNKEIDEIMNSEAFKAKAQNLAEQQLLQTKIDKKKSEILAMQNEVGTLQSELETKRNAGLSL